MSFSKFRVLRYQNSSLFFGTVLISGFLFSLIRPNFWGGRTCGDLSWLLAEMKASRSRLLVSTWLTRVLSPDLSSNLCHHLNHPSSFHHYQYLTVHFHPQFSFSYNNILQFNCCKLVGQIMKNSDHMDIKIKIVCINSNIQVSLYTGVNISRSQITSALNFASPLFIWFPIHLHWEQCGYSDDTNSTIAI